MSLNLAWQLGNFALAILCCAGAWFRGGPTERRGAAIILISWALSLLLQSHAKTGPGLWVNIIDVIVLGLFFKLSLDSRRLWTLFACACQLDTVASHFSQVFEQYSQWVYLRV